MEDLTSKLQSAISVNLERNSEADQLRSQLQMSGEQVIMMLELVTQIVCVKHNLYS